MAVRQALARFGKRSIFVKALQLGNAARDSGSWMGAIQHYHAALDTRPDATHVWVQLGHAYKEAGLPAGARRCYERALELGSDDVHARHFLNGLGLPMPLVREDGGDPPHPEREAAREATHGDAARDDRQWELAADHYAASLALRPDNFATQMQFGHALKEMGNLARARMAYLRAISLKPEDADVHLQLGHLHAVQARDEEALACYRQALRLGSDDRNARCFVARADDTEVRQDGGEVGAALQAYPRIGTVLETFVETFCASPGDADAALAALAFPAPWMSQARETETWFDIWLLLSRRGPHGTAARSFYALALAMPELAGQAEAFAAEARRDPWAALASVLESGPVARRRGDDSRALVASVRKMVQGYGPAPEPSGADRATLEQIVADADAARFIALHAWGRVFGGPLLHLLRTGWVESPALLKALPPDRVRSFANTLTLPDRWRGMLTGTMALLWASDDDLRGRFPLDALDSVAKYSHWFRSEGIRELRSANLASPVERRFLLAPDHRLDGLSRFVADIWRVRRDLRRNFDVTGRRGRLDLLSWYCLSGMAEYGCFEMLSAVEATALTAPAAHEWPEAGELSVLAYAAWRSRPDLQSQFPLDQAGRSAAYAVWFAGPGVQELGRGRWPSQLTA